MNQNHSPNDAATEAARAKAKAEKTQAAMRLLMVGVVAFAAAAALAVAALMWTLSNRQFEAQQTTLHSAAELVNALTYVKAKNGICFGVGTASRVMPDVQRIEVPVLTAVDCRAAGL